MSSQRGGGRHGHFVCCGLILAAQVPEPGEEPPNALPVYGNRETMNFNPVLLTNIQGSQYFRERCGELHTFEEILDEIYNKVTHLGSCGRF